MRLYLWLVDPVALDTDIHPGDICWYDVSQGEQSLFLPHTQTQAAPTLDSFLLFTQGNVQKKKEKKPNKC